MTRRVGHLLIQPGMAWLQCHGHAPRGFDDTPAGHAGFRAAIQAARPPAVRVAVHDPAETFHIEPLPPLGRRDRHALTQRRISAARTSQRAAALPEDRRWLRLLCLPAPGLEAPWLDLLAETGTPLAGLWSGTALAETVARTLGLRDGLLFIAHETGQSHYLFAQGTLRFARHPGGARHDDANDLPRLRAYLIQQDLLPRDAPLTVHCLGASPAPSTGIDVHALPPLSAGQLAAHWLTALQQPPACANLAHPEERRPWQRACARQWGYRAALALGCLSTALGSLLLACSDAIPQVPPALTVPSSPAQAAVQAWEQARTAARTSMREDWMALGQHLARHPAFTLERLRWQAGESPDSAPLMTLEGRFTAIAAGEATRLAGDLSAHGEWLGDAFADRPGVLAHPLIFRWRAPR